MRRFIAAVVASIVMAVLPTILTAGSITRFDDSDGKTYFIVGGPAGGSCESCVQVAQADAALTASTIGVAPPPPTVSAPAPTPAPNTFVTVKDGSATISGGSLLGQILMWAALLVGAPLAGAVVTLVVKIMQKLGVDVSDANRARLKEFVENGISLAAHRAGTELSGKLTVQTKNHVATAALAYVQDHGADTLKKLGFDPNDPKAIEALQARIAKALDDKVAATPVLNPA